VALARGAPVDVPPGSLIAVFYSDSLSAAWLLAALGGLLLVLGLRRLHVARIAVYVPIGIFVWVAVHESGVHATIAGVALGLLTPTGRFDGRRVLETLEHRLHPISAFAIVPLFALANAGVPFGGGALADAAHSRLAWAIAAGLLLGKVLGIGGATFLGLRLGWGTLPPGRPLRTGLGSGRARRHRLHRLVVHRATRLRRSRDRQHRQDRHLRGIASQCRDRGRLARSAQPSIVHELRRAFEKPLGDPAEEVAARDHADDAAAVDDRNEEHAVVQEDLGDL
jgi:hypothetical protein